MEEEVKTTISTAKLFEGKPFPCGCTMLQAHSHLVYGYQCECEKGREHP